MAGNIAHFGATKARKWYSISLESDPTGPTRYKNSKPTPVRWRFGYSKW